MLPIQKFRDRQAFGDALGKRIAAETKDFVNTVVAPLSASVWLLQGLAFGSAAPGRGRAVWVLDEFLSGSLGGSAMENSNFLDQLLRGRKIQLLDGGEIYRSLRESSLLGPFRWDEKGDTFFEATQQSDSSTRPMASGARTETSESSPPPSGAATEHDLEYQALHFRLPPLFSRGLGVRRKTQTVAGEELVQSTVLQVVPAYWAYQLHDCDEGCPLLEEPPLVLRRAQRTTLDGQIDVDPVPENDSTWDALSVSSKHEELIY